MYNNTADDVAKYFKITPRAVTDWALKGYPLHEAGRIKRVQLLGAQRVGAKEWRFNLQAVVNFIENLGNEQWVSRNVHTEQKTVNKKPLTTGRMNTLSTSSDFSAQLMALVSAQKNKQKPSANV